MKFRAYFNWYENGHIIADDFVDFEASNEDDAKEMAQIYAQNEEKAAGENADYYVELYDIERLED